MSQNQEAPDYDPSHSSRESDRDDPELLPPAKRRRVEDEPPATRHVGSDEDITRDVSPKQPEPSDGKEPRRRIETPIDLLDIADMADECQEMLARRLAEGTPSVSSLNSDERERYFRAPRQDTRFRTPDYAPPPPPPPPSSMEESGAATFKTPPKQDERGKRRSTPGGAASIAGRASTSPPRPPVPSFWEAFPSPMTLTGSMQVESGVGYTSAQNFGNQESHETEERQSEGENNQDSTAEGGAGGDGEGNDGSSGGDSNRDADSKSSTTSSSGSPTGSSDDGDESPDNQPSALQSPPCPQSEGTLYRQQILHHLPIPHLAQETHPARHPPPKRQGTAPYALNTAPIPLPTMKPSQTSPASTGTPRSHPQPPLHHTAK
ncbi:MAG: hypothetical protein Q9216_004027 [Gyalolechia sp. 2 TL-2023]